MVFLTDGDIHDENSSLCLLKRITTAQNDDEVPDTYSFGGLEWSSIYGKYTV